MILIDNFFSLLQKEA